MNLGRVLFIGKIENCTYVRAKYHNDISEKMCKHDGIYKKNKYTFQILCYKIALYINRL